MCFKIASRARNQEKGNEIVPLAASQYRSDNSRAVARTPSAQPQIRLYQDTALLRSDVENQNLGMEKQDWSKLLEFPNSSRSNATATLGHHLIDDDRHRPRNASTANSTRDRHFSVEHITEDPLSSPKISALPLAIRRTSMPDVTPFAQFCKMAPPSPSLESSRPDSLDNIKTAISTISERSSWDLGALSRDLPEVESIAASESASPKQSVFEKQPSQVLRGQGTGFEILRPGSLNPEISCDTANRPRSLMSALSLQRYGRRGLVSKLSSQPNTRGRISRLFH